MTTVAPFGLDLPSTDPIGRWVWFIVGVGGAACLGGFTVGLITQGLSRLLTTRPVPRIPLIIVRLLGAVVCGWVMALILLPGSGRGGSGDGWWPFGGPGGSGTASGKEQAAETDREGGTGREGGPPETSKATPGDGLTLQVEVLPEYDSYRVKTPEGALRVLNFDDLTAYLLKQKGATPPVTGIKVFRGSSKENAPSVTRLTNWAAEQGRLRVEIPNTASP
jgi:hypothetical protein